MMSNKASSKSNQSFSKSTVPRGQSQSQYPSTSTRHLSQTRVISSALITPKDLYLRTGTALTYEVRSSLPRTVCIPQSPARKSTTTLSIGSSANPQRPWFARAVRRQNSINPTKATALPPRMEDKQERLVNRLRWAGRRVQKREAVQLRIGRRPGHRAAKARKTTSQNLRVTRGGRRGERGA